MKPTLAHQWEVPVIAPYCSRCGAMKSEPRALLPCQAKGEKDGGRLL